MVEFAREFNKGVNSLPEEQKETIRKATEKDLNPPPSSGKENSKKEEGKDKPTGKKTRKV